MGEREGGPQGPGILPLLALAGTLAAQGVRAAILVRHPGGPDHPQPSLLPWIAWGGAPALLLCIAALLLAKRARRGPGVVLSTLMLVLNVLFIFISL